MNQKQIEVAPLHKQQGHRILPNYRNATHVREIACVNYVFQISLTKSKNIRRIWFQKQFTTNKIRKTTFNICNAQV